jgi:hypothetical protein
MFYHVSPFRLLVRGIVRTLILYMPIPQLRIWARDDNLSNHVPVSIVRLIVETNLATSKDLRISML